MSETTTESKLRTITPEMLGNFTERVNIDPNANAFAKPAPIPDGLYVGQLGVPAKTGRDNDRDALQGGTDKNGHDYFFGNFEVKVIQSATPEISNEVLKGRSKTLRGRVTTFEKTDDKGLTGSEMGTLVSAAGLPTGSILGELGFAYLEAITKGAKVGVITQWQAGHMVPVAGKPGVRTWEVVRRGMTSFPKNYNTQGEHDGTYNPTITYNGEELTARAEAVGFVRI